MGSVRNQQQLQFSNSIKRRSKCY
uniref:Uncharacterized protein n=1 Tax=Arundo donax TaxID=35708 RepID=A0A0A9EYI6_ARUDO